MAALLATTTPVHVFGGGETSTLLLACCFLLANIDCASYHGPRVTTRAQVCAAEIHPSGLYNSVRGPGNGEFCNGQLLRFFAIPDRYLMRHLRNARPRSGTDGASRLARDLSDPSRARNIFGRPVRHSNSRLLHPLPRPGCISLDPCPCYRRRSSLRL